MSDNVETLNFFAAIPGRALRDAELTGLDFRVLGAVAGHDRMGRNGQLCWAGRNALAKGIGCNPTALSESLSKLCAKGYLERGNDPNDRRKTGYRVVYDQRADAAGIGARVRENRSATADVSPVDRSATADANDIRKSRKDYIKQQIAEIASKRNIYSPEGGKDIFLKKENNNPAPSAHGVDGSHTPVMPTSHPPDGNAEPVEMAQDGREDDVANPRTAILRLWYGDDQFEPDGNTRLGHLTDWQWRILIGFWRKGTLTTVHRDWAISHADSERQKWLRAAAVG